MPQSGHLSITCPWSKDVLFNVVRGHWPGGTYGVLCHETRMLTGYSPGIFHSGAISEAGVDWKGLLNPLEVFVPLIGGDGEHYFKTPYTTAGSRVPHLATITGLHVARRAERHEGDNAVWTTRPLDDLGLDGHWVAAIRRNSDQATAERLLAGPVRELLREQQGLGFELRIEYGQAIVARAGLPAPRRGPRRAGGGRREAGHRGARDLRAALRRPPARLRARPAEVAQPLCASSRASRPRRGRSGRS